MSLLSVPRAHEREYFHINITYSTHTKYSVPVSGERRPVLSGGQTAEGRGALRAIPCNNYTQRFVVIRET